MSALYCGKQGGKKAGTEYGEGAVVGTCRTNFLYSMVHKEGCRDTYNRKGAGYQGKLFKRP